MIRNPFIETLTIPFIRVINSKPIPYKLANGEEITDYYDVEQQEFARIYKNYNNYLSLSKLSGNANKLYLFITYSISKDAQSIKLDEKELCGLFKCGDRQIKRIKAELIDEAIIIHNKDNRYWVNPRFFASGNRLTMFPENKVLITTIDNSDKK